jgi:hypothetical protein
MKRQKAKQTPLTSARKVDDRSIRRYRADIAQNPHARDLVP